MHLSTVVYGKKPVEFYLYGASKPQTLFETGEEISSGLARRILAYAFDTLDSAGFKKAVDGWKIEVYTIDAEERPADRRYCVRWTNNYGGYIEVVGIYTKNGWPFLDHGLVIGR